MPASQNSPIARPGDIVTALREVLRKNGGGAILKSVRASKAGEVSPGTPAYYLLYKFDSQGKEYTAMGYFAPLVYGGDNPWQLYSSVVYAQSAQFAKLAPTLAQVWKSWKPNGQKPLEGSNSAVFDKVIKERIDSYEEIQKLFREQL